MKIFPYRKVLVVGCGGAGKSVFSRAMGERFSLPVVHLDKLWWLSGWVERTEEEFDALLAKELEKSSWIMDGNYCRTLERRLQYCDAVIYLDIATEECLKSAYARVEEYKGKTRPDMTAGCPERIDEEFEQWILNFNTSVREHMLELLSQSGKPVFIFSTREEAYVWLNTFVQGKAEE